MAPNDEQVAAANLTRHARRDPAGINSAGDGPAENGGSNGCNTGSTGDQLDGGDGARVHAASGDSGRERGHRDPEVPITFTLPASANATIMPTSELPAVTAAGVTIDGGPGLGGVVLDGINVTGSSTVGLELSGGG